MTNPETNGGAKKISLAAWIVIVSVAGVVVATGNRLDPPSSHAGFWALPGQ